MEIKHITPTSSQELAIRQKAQKPLRGIPARQNEARFGEEFELAKRNPVF